MKTALKIVILLPLTILIVLLAIANRAPVTLSLDPFSATAPAYSITVPLFWVMFAAVAVGVVLGGIASWLIQGKYRKAARSNRSEAERLRGEADRLRTALSSRLPPALPQS